MADLPTELTQSMQLTDPETGNGTQDLLQKINALIRALRDHETRITDLE
jgi:hypothetical protein